MAGLPEIGVHGLCRLRRLLGFQWIQVRNDDEVAKNTGMALLKGDPEGLDVMRDTAKAVFTEGVERVEGSLHLGHEK